MKIFFLITSPPRVRVVWSLFQFFTGRGNQNLRRVGPKEYVCMQYHYGKGSLGLRAWLHPVLLQCTSLSYDVWRIKQTVVGNQKYSGKWYCILFCFRFCYFSSNCLYFFLKLLLLNHHTRGKLLLCPWICHCANYLDAVCWIYSASFQYKFCNTQTNKMNNSYLKNKKPIFFGNYGFWIFRSLIEIWPTKNWSNLRIHKRIFKLNFDMLYNTRVVAP